MNSLGQHLLIDYFHCSSELIGSQDQVRKILLQAAALIEATVVTDVFHQFNPHGVSGVVVIAESHLAVHTWPEHRCAAIDIFSCSPKLDLKVLVEFLKAQFESDFYESKAFFRGEFSSRQLDRSQTESFQDV